MHRICSKHLVTHTLISLPIFQFVIQILYANWVLFRTTCYIKAEKNIYLRHTNMRSLGRLIKFVLSTVSRISDTFCRMQKK